MVLPSSGQISFNDLRIELNVTTQSPFSITDAVTGVYTALNPAASPQPDTATPHAISEWWGYDHCIALNGGVNIAYNNTTPPEDPGDCFDVLVDYPFAQPLYSTNCSTLATSCKIYDNSNCTSPAYNGTQVRYLNDGNNYWPLNTDSTVGSATACN
jgi:hypothetical protein